MPFGEPDLGTPWNEEDASGAPGRRAKLVGSVRGTWNDEARETTGGAPARPVPRLLKLDPGAPGMLPTRDSTVTDRRFARELALLIVVYPSGCAR